MGRWCLEAGLGEWAESHCGRIALSVLILLKSSKSLAGGAGRLPCGRGLPEGEEGLEAGHREGEAGFVR